MEKQNKMKYYHNNRCRKSREGLAFLESKNIHPEIINYLDDKYEDEQDIFKRGKVSVKLIQMGNNSKERLDNFTKLLIILLNSLLLNDFSTLIKIIIEENIATVIEIML